MDIMLEIDDHPMFSAVQQLMDIPEELEKAFNPPTRAYVRERKAMRTAPADVKELPGATEYVLDMPGINSAETKVQVEEGNMLVISGERKRPADEDKEKEAKYLRMERRMGKFMRKFPLPDNANTDAITATYKEGVLTVTVEKLPPPESKKPKTIEVKVA